MPIRGVLRYRVKHTAKGPIRLAFAKGGKVVEAKNMDTGAIHTKEEFKADRQKKSRKKSRGK